MFENISKSYVLSYLAKRNGSSESEFEEKTAHFAI